MLKFRTGTIDQDAWSWVVQANEYGLPPALDAHATIVDVGVHIGSFVQACWNRGARHIVGYEVDVQNYALARHNVGHLEGVELHDVAIDRSDDRFTGAVRFGGYTPRDHGGVNTGSGDIFGGEAGVAAAALRFDDVPGRRDGEAPPVIDLLKLDCEGAEWPILYTAKSLDRVRAIVGEYHTLPGEVEARLGLARPCTPDALRAFLAEAGFAEVEVGAPDGVHHGVYQCGKFRATRSPRGQAPRAAELSQARALASQGDARGALAVCAAILQADKANVEAFRMYRELYLATQGKDLSHAEIFDFIYTANVWLYGSGAGSLPETTERYRIFLQDFIRANGIRSVVDAGCGDWQFSRLIDWSGVDYLGIDVSAVVLDNTRNHAAQCVRFLEGDVRTLALPDADLLIMKDVMQHWSNADILVFLPQLRHFRHCLITNGFPPERMQDLNGDALTGGWRPVDLSAPPFHLAGAYVFTFMADEEKRVFLITRLQAPGDPG